jgi:hypothetical protein
MFRVENGNIYVEEEFRLAFRDCFDENGAYKNNDIKLLFHYLFYNYAKESPYRNMTESGRIAMMLKKHGIDAKKIEKEYADIIRDFKEIYFTQEDRVKESLIKRIDDAIAEFSKFKIDPDLIMQLPKLSKAVMDLLKIKEQLEDMSSKKNTRGDKRLSLLEQNRLK